MVGSQGIGTHDQPGAREGPAGETVRISDPSRESPPARITPNALRLFEEGSDGGESRDHCAEGVIDDGRRRTARRKRKRQEQKQGELQRTERVS